MNEQKLEQLTCALNAERYAEAAGLPTDPARAAGLTAELEAILRQAVDEPAYHGLALDGLADARALAPTQRLDSLRESVLVYPALNVDGEPAAWHNWKKVQRAVTQPQDLRRLFDFFVEQSQALAPAIQERYASRRQLYAHYGTTPLEVFARREGTTPETLRHLAVQVGDFCRQPFRLALGQIARQVLGPLDVTAAELQALYLNRMYAPLAPLFASRDALADIRASFGRLGFSIDAIALDFEDRPQKYAGAFCFPVQIPGDVRVSVRPASPHHLADMLFHEFGHAVHFSGIDAAQPFADRYWIHSGTHETFATLFESWLGLPEFLRVSMGFEETAVRQLTAFDQFKSLITGTWLAAAGATASDAWLDNLAWPQVEERLVQYLQRFTGLSFPAGWARLDQFVNNLDPYPLGYVIAAVRVAHWRQALETDFGPHWWCDRRAGAAIAAKIRLGGGARFDPAWLNPEPFLRHLAATDADRVKDLI